MKISAKSGLQSQKRSSNTESDRPPTGDILIMRSKMRIVIHAGSLKTGSTYIQSMVWRSLPTFEKAGIIIPKTGVQSEHHYDIARATGFGYAAHRMGEKTAQNIITALQAELETSTANTALISSEHFDVGVSESSIERLKQALEGHQIDVVIYLRNQVDLMQSLYFEHLKWGGTVDYEGYSGRTLKSGMLDYYGRISRWMSSGVNVRVLDYCRAQDRLKESFIDIFSGAVSVDDLNLPSASVNRSLSPEAMEYLRHKNIELQDPSERRKFYVKLYKTLHSMGSRWVVSRNLPLPETISSALESLTDGNQRLAKLIGYEGEFLRGDLVDYMKRRKADPSIDMKAFHNEVVLP